MKKSEKNEIALYYAVTGNSPYELNEMVQNHEITTEEKNEILEMIGDFSNSVVYSNVDTAIYNYPINASARTIKKMEELKKDGYSFVPGCNPFLNTSKKWTSVCKSIVRVARTNSFAGCKATMWAVK